MIFEHMEHISLAIKLVHIKTTRRHSALTRMSILREANMEQDEGKSEHTCNSA